MTAADRDTLAALDRTLAAWREAAEGGAVNNGNRAVLALLDLIAERDGRVAAQTLRDAANALLPDYAPEQSLSVALVAAWLRDRADTTGGTHHE